MNGSRLCFRGVVRSPENEGIEVNSAIVAAH